jgi:hypothetical protein
MFAFAAASLLTFISAVTATECSQIISGVEKCREFLMDHAYEIALFNKIQTSIQKGTRPAQMETATGFPAIVNTTTPGGRGDLLVLLRDLEIHTKNGQAAPQLKNMAQVIIWQTSFHTSTPRYVGVYWNAANCPEVFLGSGFLR